MTIAQMEPTIQQARAHPPRTALRLDAKTFADNFDKHGFLLEHELAGHPLLDLPAIAALSERLPQNLLEWNSEQAGAFTGPDRLKPHHLSCRETILRVEREPARILLLQIEHDPLYKALLDELLDTVQRLAETPQPDMLQRQAFLFISSREAFTPFHFDPDYNFLLQSRGQKTVHVWDPADRKVLPTSALDAYYAGKGRDPRYANRDQCYREEFMSSARRLTMSAGQGVHIPLHAPHAVVTESDVSVSLSITFRTRRSQFNAMVHGANGHVRSLGLVPPEPGVSRLWDIAANVAFRGVRKTAALTKRLFA